jgi:hypothetical protein
MTASYRLSACGGTIELLLLHDLMGAEAVIIVDSVLADAFWYTSNGAVRRTRLQSSRKVSKNDVDEAS